MLNQSINQSVQSRSVRIQVFYRMAQKCLKISNIERLSRTCLPGLQGWMVRYRDERGMYIPLHSGLISGNV